MYMEVVNKVISGERIHAFFTLFSFTWNVNVMAGALEALLGPEDVVKP